MSYPDFMANAYKSERLVYRAIEDNEEDKAWIACFLLNDPTATINGTRRLAHPAPVSSAQDYINSNKDNLLEVMICIELSPQDSVKLTPIGTVSLGQNSQVKHHRHATMSVNIIALYRGKGYGAEAINWALDWGFRRAALHRVGIGAFSYNIAALHLYKKLGFVEEGREREILLYDRKWHDSILLGMLEHEWEKLRGIKSS